jgi:hypothetical protein
MEHTYRMMSSSGDRGNLVVVSIGATPSQSQRSEVIATEKGADNVVGNIVRGDDRPTVSFRAMNGDGSVMNDDQIALMAAQLADSVS